MIPTSRPHGSDLKKIAVDEGITAGDHWVTVAAVDIREALRAAQADGYTFFSFITCVDHLARQDGAPPHAGPVETTPPRFEIVYQLRDLAHARQLRIRAFLPDGEQPTIDSAHDLYGPANWDEREVWDLFGIHFEGHPDLTRILLPDDWEGHPLRRDYPVGGDPVDFSQDHDEWQTTPVQA